MVCVVGIVSYAERARAVQILYGASCDAIVCVRGRIEMACERVCDVCTVWPSSACDEVDGADHLAEFSAVGSSVRVIVCGQRCVSRHGRGYEFGDNAEFLHETIDHFCVCEFDVLRRASYFYTEKDRWKSVISYGVKACNSLASSFCILGLAHDHAVIYMRCEDDCQVVGLRGVPFGDAGMRLATEPMWHRLLES